MKSELTAAHKSRRMTDQEMQALAVRISYLQSQEAKTERAIEAARKRTQMANENRGKREAESLLRPRSRISSASIPSRPSTAAARLGDGTPMPSLQFRGSTRPGTAIGVSRAPAQAQAAVPVPAVAEEGEFEEVVYAVGTGGWANARK